MTKENIQIWCDQNNYALIEKRTEPIEFEEVARIAEQAVNAESGTISDKRRNEELTFARYMVATYLYDHMPAKIISRKLNFDHTLVSYAVNQRLFDEAEIKFMKPWQRSAVRQFMYQIQIAGDDTKQPELRIRGNTGGKFNGN